MRIIEADLNRLREMILNMGNMAVTAIELAMRAVIERDSSLAERVIADDDEIDRLENDIDKLATDIMVLRQPAAGDLRFTVTVLHTSPTIERVADHAVNIAKHARVLNREPRLEPYLDLPRMSELTSAMLRNSLQALINGDTELARAVMREDDKVDDLYRRIYEQLLEIMQSDATTIKRGSELLFIIKHLERVADYATNICEMVTYMIEGRIIKHTQEAS